MKILYFAWLREKVGTGEEDVTPPETVATVGDLAAWLAGQSDGHKAAFEDPKVVRVAVNQEYVQPDHPVKQGDEIAFFPPVTGG